MNIYNNFPDKAPNPFLTLPDLNITIEGISNLLANFNIHKKQALILLLHEYWKTFHAVAPILKIIFCSYFLTGVVTWDWRTANIIPIYKMGIVKFCKLQSHITYKLSVKIKYLRK